MNYFSGCYVDIMSSYQYKYNSHYTIIIAKILFVIGIIIGYSYIFNIIPSTTIIILTYQVKVCAEVTNL